MVTTKILILLYYVLLAFQLLRSSNYERRRQRVITWPRTEAVLTVEDPRYPLKIHGKVVGGALVMSEKFVYYSSGSRHECERLCPASQDFKVDASVLQRKLAAHSRYRIYLNPDRPQESFLSPGKGQFGWWLVIIYAFWGVVLPLGIYLFARHADQLSDTVATIASILFWVGLFVVMPIFSMIDFSQVKVPVSFSDIDPLPEGGSAPKMKQKAMAG